MKRYTIELMGCFMAYAILLVLSPRLLAQGVDDQTLRVVITLLPVIPAVFICWVVLRGLFRVDEMQRKLQFEALAFSFAGTALITLGYGFLENVGYPKLSMFAVWPIMAALWGLGGVIGRLRIG